MKSTLAVALVLSAVAPFARAEVTTLDVVGGTVFATSIEGARAVENVRTADGGQVRYEVLSQGAAPLPIQGVSHSVAGLAVHTGQGGSAPLTTAFFRYGDASASHGATALRHSITGAVTKASHLRTIVLDPNDTGAVLLDASHVAFPGGQTRMLVYVKRSSGEALLVDYDPAGGAVRRTPLGFTPPIGSNKGSFTVAPDGALWAAFAYAGGVRMFSFYDLLISSVVQPTPKGVIAAGAGFDPDSTRVGIIAILIGLLAQPTPAVSYQVGEEVIVAAQDGGTFRTVARQTVPPQASGLIESEGISFYFILPYIEQENVYRGTVGGEAEPILSAGH